MNKYNNYKTKTFKKSPIFVGLLSCGLTFTSVAINANETPAVEEEKSVGLEIITVTSQKRVERLQDVPIAVSAFTQENLDSQGVVGGPDLKLSVPNISFGESGFGRYNFQIRGIGGHILGSSADVGVGIHTNNIPLTESRLVQSEFYDVERVEVLRGPQGTLYGRNATGGVVNIITTKAEHYFSGSLSGEYASYNTRKIKGHINLPVIDDKLAVRLAGTAIKRDGNIENLGTGNDVNSRDLFSTRLSVLWEPTDSFRVNAIWEHFDQDDSSGAGRKIICAPEAGPQSIGGVATNPFTSGLLSRGCAETDVESKENNGVAKNLSSLPGIFGVLSQQTPLNVFEGKTVSTDIHNIESDFDPSHSATNDLFSLEMVYDINENLSFTSLSSYSEDEFLTISAVLGGVPDIGFNDNPLSPGGVFNDPQLGPKSVMSSNYYYERMSEQFTQEFRIQSNYDGDINFNLGLIYMDFDTDVKNIALGTSVNQMAIILNATENAGIYIDPSFPPDGTGHNYYNNQEPYQLKASAVFGELYYNINDDIKATFGLRYTKDDKTLERNEVQMLEPGRGFPPAEVVNVVFEEITGRMTLDWKLAPDNMLYASYARGYKGGGFNPGGTVGESIKAEYAPEFVNSIEFGTKNLFLDSTLSLNASVFYYDYQGYQISKQINQSVATENVNAEVTGLELEIIYEPIENLRLNAQLGLLNSEISEGESIDVIDRVQGVEGFSHVRSLDSENAFAATCIAPTAVLAGVQADINAGNIPVEAMGFMCGQPFASEGNAVQLEGKALPYSADWTLSLGAEYLMEISNEWLGIVRADYFVQDESYARIYNSDYDKIQGYDNLNLSYRLENTDSGIEVLFYARNLLSEDSITNITVQGDDTGGGRFVSGKEQPIYGISFTKRWE